MAEETAVKETVADTQQQDDTETTTANESKLDSTAQDSSNVDEGDTATKSAQGDNTDEKPRSKHSRTDRADAHLSKRNRNNRSNYDSLKESKDESEIRKQVEFYFSDSNLPTDAYLLRLTGGFENNPVPLKVIHEFKRMRHFQPFSAIRDAVMASKVLNLNGKDEITRKVPLDKKFTDDVKSNAEIMYDASMARSVYAKGFGREYDTMQLDIETFFKPYGPVKSVRMRRHADGSFKGSVFVEFATDELAKQFLEQEPKPTWYSAKQDTNETDEKKERELKIMSKLSYVKEKNEGIRDGTVRPGSPRSYARGGGRGRGGRPGRGGRGGRGGRRDRHDIDTDDWRERRDRDRRDRDRRDRGSGRDENDNSKERSRDESDATDNKEDTNKRSRDESDAPDNKEDSKKRSRDEYDTADTKEDTKKQKADDD